MTDVAHVQRKEYILYFGGSSDVNDIFVLLPSGGQDNSVV